MLSFIGHLKRPKGHSQAHHTTYYTREATGLEVKVMSPKQDPAVLRGGSRGSSGWSLDSAQTRLPPFDVSVNPTL